MSPHYNEVHLPFAFSWERDNFILGFQCTLNFTIMGSQIKSNIVYNVSDGHCIILYTIFVIYSIFLVVQVITLLLCVAIRCDNVAVFVNQITQLDVEDQYIFKFLVESVLTELDSGSLTAESFATILSKKGWLHQSQCMSIIL